MRKIFKRLHLWFSIPFGIIIAVICLSGSVLVFENDITDLMRRDLLIVNSVGEQTLSMDSLMHIAQNELKEGQQITGVSIFPDSQSTYRFNLSTPKRGFISIDPYTGEMKGVCERSPFFLFFFRLHRWLLISLDPNGGISWGRVIVGTSTICFTFILLTGICIWVPKSGKALKNRLSIKTKKGSKRLVYDAHVCLGIYAVLFLLIMSLTGPTWSFEWYRNGFYDLFGAKSTSKSTGKNTSIKKSEDSESKINYAVWDGVIAESQQKYSDYNQLIVSDGSITVQYPHWGNQRESDMYKFDKQNGQIVDFIPYASIPKAAKLRGWIYSMHIGDWGGYFSKILYFLSVLIGFILPLTGLYIWISRKVRKKR